MVGGLGAAARNFRFVTEKLRMRGGKLESVPIRPSWVLDSISWVLASLCPDQADNCVVISYSRLFTHNLRDCLHWWPAANFVTLILTSSGTQGTLLAVHIFFLPLASERRSSDRVA